MKYKITSTCGRVIYYKIITTNTPKTCLCCRETTVMRRRTYAPDRKPHTFIVCEKCIERRLNDFINYGFTVEIA